MTIGLAVFIARCNLVRDLLTQDQEARIDGREQPLTLLFSDVQGFTSLSEGMPPQRLIDALGNDLDVVTKAVQELRGTIDKHYLLDMTHRFPENLSVMKKVACSLILSALTLLTVSCASGPGGNRGLVSTTDARQIETKSRTALDQLYRTNPKALDLAKNAKGVLVFPAIIKGGLVVGASAGDGALYQRNQATGYYRSVSASYGLQAGLQKFGYALFLMDDKAMQGLNKSGGWELGSAPSLTVLDKGAARSLSTTTLKKGTYAIFFDQKGLMAGLGFQGTKVTQLAIQP